MIKRTVMGLDLGTHVGYCIGVPGERPAYGSVHLVGNGAEDGSLGCAFLDWIGDQVAFHNPSLVAYEAALPAGKQSSINSAQIALGLAMLIKVVCWRRSVTCVPYHVKTVRAQVVGNGNATKPMVADWLASRGWTVPLLHGEVDADAVDAVAVWAAATGIKAYTKKVA